MNKVGRVHMGSAASVVLPSVVAAAVDLYSPFE